MVELCNDLILMWLKFNILYIYYTCNNRSYVVLDCHYWLHKNNITIFYLKLFS